MSILNRYKKTGGFKQLLELIESCGLKKRANLMRIIREEDKAWADAIDEKVLTVEKFFKWPDEALMEVFPNVQDISVAAGFHLVEEGRRAELVCLLDLKNRREVQTMLDEKEFSPNDIAASGVKMVSTARQLVYSGKLKVDKFAPELIVPQGIEEMLDKKSISGLSKNGASQKWLHKVEDTLKKEKSTRDQESENMRQIQTSFEKLKSRIIHLEKENNRLEGEVHEMKGRLEKIKRIA